MKISNKISTKNHRVFGIFNEHNKRCFRADDHLSLSSALRPRLLLITLLLSMLFITLSSNTQSVSADSITLTVPKIISVDILPKAGGNFAKSSQGVISVKTDNKLGYTLSVKTSNNNLLNGSNQISSIPNSTSEEGFRTDAKFNNTWGFLPSKLDSVDNSDFLPGTSGEELALDTTESANTVDNNYDITLGAKIDDVLAAGSYTGTLTISSIGNSSNYMQNWRGCNALKDGRVTSLIDERDGNVYSVAKLKDGKCWMLNNLQLGKEEETMQLTPADSDLNYDYTLPAISWANCNAFDQDKYPICNDPTYGGYYTFEVATGGEDTTGAQDAEIQATGSICPKGWHLPTATEGGDFKTLLNYYSDFSALTSSPIPGFQAGGSVYSGSFRDKDKTGYYMTANATTGQMGGYSNIFSFSSSKAEILSNGDSYGTGYNVRCVADSDKDPLVMQNVSDWGNSVQEGEVKNVLDSRDGNYYNVTKLKDGKLWMIDNLRLGNRALPSNLTPEDSDLKQEYDINKYATYYSNCSNFGKTSTYVQEAPQVCSDSTYGGYYTFSVATAESVPSYTEEDGSALQATSSICPKGWRLPSATESGDFNTLLNYYGDFNALTNIPIPNFQAGGYAYSGSFRDKSSTGYYLTSDAIGGAMSNQIYLFSFKSSGTEVSTSWDSNYGYNIRCVRK